MNLIYLAVTAVATITGFVIARDFVRRRLRFVDAVRSPAAPWLVGLGAALVAWPVALLPLVTTATTTLFGIGAGLGTASGVKALRSGDTR
ncbi:MAG: hypothetical protein SF070_06815 [Gemmatimonadota bacterium]|nr:hypothetical protein [Gemmatimonadota bacterium]